MTSTTGGGLRTDGLAAALLVFLVPLARLSVLGINSIDVGIALALAIGLVWVTKIGHYRGAPLLVTVLVGALVSGPFLAWHATSGDAVRGLDGRAELRLSGLLFAGIVTLGVLLWAREHLSVRAVAITYAAGALLNAALTPDLWKNNPWKFAFAWPTAILLLALVSRCRTRWPTVAALTMLSLLAVMNDYRSLLGFCILTAGVFIWRFGRADKLSRQSLLRVALFAALVSVITYQGGTWLALHGYLGGVTQARTEQQLATGESLITSGRPEGAAAIALAKREPLGLGPGVIPSSGDVEIGKSGLSSVHASTESEYVDQYLFGGHVGLHSVTSDLWVNFGPFGLLAAALAGLALAQALFTSVISGSPALPILATIVALWDLAFSPMGSNLHEVIFAVALTLPALGAGRRRQQVAALGWLQSPTAAVSLGPNSAA